MLLHSPVADIIDALIPITWGTARNSSSPAMASFPVEISEDANGYLLKAELPGLRKEDIKVSVEDGTLKISGETKQEKTEGRKCHYSERKYGAFSRSFTLAEDIDGKSVKATHRDGILEVRLSKAEETKPKAISVKIE